MIAEKLNKLLEQHDITPYRLARITGISDAMIHRYLKGEATPRWTTLLKIADPFDIDVSEFYKE